MVELVKLGKLDQVLDLYPKYRILVEDQATHLVFYRNGGVEVLPRKSK